MSTISVIVAVNIQANSASPSMPSITTPAVSIDIQSGGLSGLWVWSPGAGPGMSLADVAPRDWSLIAAQAQINLNGFFGSPSSYGTAFQLNSFGTPSTDPNTPYQPPNVNDIGSGIFNGSSNDMPSSVSWFVSNIF